MQVIAVANLKGGTGKTTIAINLALQYRARGKRTLYVDLDPNNNGTDFFLRTEDPDSLAERSILQVLARQRSLKDCTYLLNDDLSVVPATVELNSLEYAIQGNPAPLLSLRGWLSQGEYDVVVLDCPPHASATFRAGLWAADLVVSPIIGSRWVLQGAQFLEKAIADAATITGRQAPLLLVPNQVTRGAFEREKLIAIRQHFNVSKAELPVSVPLRRMSDKGKEIKPATKIDQALRELAEEVIAWKDSPMALAGNG